MEHFISLSIILTGPPMSTKASVANPNRSEKNFSYFVKKWLKKGKNGIKRCVKVQRGDTKCEESGKKVLTHGNLVLKIVAVLSFVVFRGKVN